MIKSMWKSQGFHMFLYAKGGFLHDNQPYLILYVSLDITPRKS